MRAATKMKLLAGVGALGWLASIGALDPRLWRETLARERERLPEQLREAFAAGTREARRAEAALDAEVQEAFRTARP